MTTLRIGTAGWSIPATEAAHFAAEGSALERYSSRFNAVEINSSFHRPHRSSTWQRWGESVPEHFRFAVKMPKTISHERKLVDCNDLIDRLMAEVSGLGDKLGVFLLQLPPKLAFDEEVATHFFEHLVACSPAQIVCEPRHPGWFEADAEAVLVARRIARAAADPAPVPAAGSPGGWPGVRYWRLHGSPQMYRSSYGDRIDELAATLSTAALEDASAQCETWCCFDNTASSAATGDALALQQAVGDHAIDDSHQTGARQS